MKANFAVFLGTELVLSLVTLYGLWRMRDVARGSIWKLMYTQVFSCLFSDRTSTHMSQGWLWPILAIAMQTPTVVGAFQTLSLWFND